MLLDKERCVFTFIRN